MASGLSKAAHLSYSSGRRCFIDFCLQFGLLNPDNSILPASAITILRFISYLSLSYQPSTVKSYLSAVRSLRVVMGLDNPFVNHPRAQLVLRGIKRLQGNNRRLRRPIAPELLLLFRDKLDLSSYEQSLQPVPSPCPIAHKRSKSDPFRDTCTVVVGRNNSALCPVEALLKYLCYRGGRPGPLFHFSRWVSSHRGFIELENS